MHIDTHLGGHVPMLPNPNTSQHSFPACASLISPPLDDPCNGEASPTARRSGADADRDLPADSGESKSTPESEARLILATRVQKMLHRHSAQPHSAVLREHPHSRYGSASEQKLCE